MLITEEWVLFWYQCLSENRDYTRYCDAVERKDHQTCDQIEAKFSKVKEIYRDFGSLGGWPEGGLNGAYWKQWYARKRHLFMRDVHELTVADGAALPVGHALLHVPLLSDRSQVLTLLNRYLDQVYLGPAREFAAPPKYQLHMRGGRVACGYQQVRQAIHTSTVSYAIDPETHEYVTVRTAMLRFIKHEREVMGWNIRVRIRDELDLAETMNEDDFEKFKSMINKCRRDFKALSQNTIRGRFPDLTPFDSEVMDQFWGE